MSQPTGNGVLIGVASDHVSVLSEKDKKNPVFKNVKSGWITLAQQDQQVALKGKFNCGTDQTAQQMKAMAEGLKAAGIMLANGDPTPSFR